MEEHARNSKLMLSLISPQYFDSGFCRAEILSASAANVPIIEDAMRRDTAGPSVFELDVFVIRL